MGPYLTRSLPKGTPDGDRISWGRCSISANLFPPVHEAYWILDDLGTQCRRGEAKCMTLWVVFIWCGGIVKEVKLKLEEKPIYSGVTADVL